MKELTYAEINEKLLKQAAEYAAYEENPTYEKFAEWVGYDPEWMWQFTDEPEGEPMTEAEIEEINEVIKDAWEEFITG